MSDPPPIEQPPTLDLSSGRTEREDPGVDDSRSPVGQTIHGLEVREEIGRGGMGEVYKAWDPALQRWVALKVLPQGSGSDEALERFLREARSASVVKHDHVAQVFLAGTWRERPYYAMEWVDGPSLAEVRKQEGRLSGQRTLEWMIDAAEGLEAAQKAGVIHRDVKPSNLVVDSSGDLKVVDFGLARRLGVDSTLTRADSVMGTPHYMSPEQATGRLIDHRSDIYSLGATFYELLTGRPPFEGDTPIEVASQHVLVEPMAVDERNPHVPEWLSRVIGRMLAKEPSDRYPSYSELLGDLRSLRSGPVRKLAAPARPKESMSGFKTWAAVLTVGLLLGIWLGGGDTPVLDQTGVAVDSESPREGAPEVTPSSSSPPPPSAVAEFEEPGDVPLSDEPVGGFEDYPAEEVAPTEPVDPWAAAPEIRGGPEERPTVSGNPEAETERTLRALAQDVENYQRRSGTYPATLGAASSREAFDGWGQPINYHRLPQRGYVLASPGADGTPRTADDLLWNRGRIVRGGPLRRP